MFRIAMTLIAVTEDTSRCHKGHELQESPSLTLWILQHGQPTTSWFLGSVSSSLSIRLWLRPILKKFSSTGNRCRWG